MIYEFKYESKMVKLSRLVLAGRDAPKHRVLQGMFLFWYSNDQNCCCWVLEIEKMKHRHLPWFEWEFENSNCTNEFGTPEECFHFDTPIIKIVVVECWNLKRWNNAICYYLSENLKVLTERMNLACPKTLGGPQSPTH